MAEPPLRQSSDAPSPKTRALRVAVIEQDPIIADLYVDAIRTGIRPVHAAACWFDDAGTNADTAIDLATADVYLCSAGSKPESQFDSLTRLLLMRPEAAVIVLLPPCAGHQLERAVACGAADVLLRTHGYLDQIPATIRRVALHALGIGYADARYRRLRDSLEAIRAENRTLAGLIDRLESLAMTDPLTGLLNRRAFDRALGRAFAASHRHGHPLACLAVDADGFKRINDLLGHAAGDELLRLIAQTIIAECRESDIAARLGGDEFCVLLPYSTAEAAGAVAERLLSRFRRDAARWCDAHGCDLRPSLTIGVSCRASENTTPSRLVEAADAALYDGKRSGRGRVVVGSSTLRHAA